MGKKLLCFIMAASMLAGLSACGNKTVAMDTSAKVETVQGGFVAETEKYVYFINGVESYSTNYKTGSVTKGALMRTEKTNLASEDTSTATYETVVSKLIVSDDKNAGFYIYGDYVYYAVPSTENDKTGNIKNDQLNFFKTKLDGSSTSKNIPGRDFTHSAKFRYIQSGNNVYLVVYSTELYVYNANDGKELYTTEAKDGANAIDKVDVSEVIFAEDNGGTNVYFTSIPVNKTLSTEDNVQKDSHHVVYQVSLGSSTASATAKVVIDGIGKKTIGNEEDGTGVDTLGATIDLLRYKGGELYFSWTSLNTVVGEASYMLIPETEFDNADWNNREWNKDSYVLTAINDRTTTIFADTSIIVDKNTVLYVNSEIGLLAYDYAKESDPETDRGTSIVYSSETIKGATLLFVNKEGNDNILYFYDSAKNLYKLNVTKAVAGDDVEEFRINKVTLDTVWYKPEVVEVGGKYYLIAIYSDSTYDSYAYVINMTDLEAAYNAITDDEEKENFYTVDTEDEEAIDAIQSTLLGVKLDSDKDE